VKGGIILHPSQQWFENNLGERIIKALENNKIPAKYFKTSKEAKEFILDNIPMDATVGIGGSVTIRQLGLIKALEERGNKLFHHWHEEMGHDEDGNKLDNWYRGLDLEVRRQALLSDVYLCSTNAVTRDGKLVNADGNANRTAAMTFGPKKVIIIAGKNKIVDDVDAGIARIKNVAAPMSAHRGKANTPCATTGVCTDCSSTDRACSVITIVEKKPKMTDMTFILVGEDLGF
jgi:hypothetical protein